MTEDLYPIEFDPSNGRAYVKISDEINATKLGSTFIAISMNKSWIDGDRSVLWQIENAYIPESFEFLDAFKTTQIAQVYTKPGKSAFVVNKSSQMQKEVAQFYKTIATTTTERKIELFYSEKEAIAWLDI